MLVVPDRGECRYGVEKIFGSRRPHCYRGNGSPVEWSIEPRSLIAPADGAAGAITTGRPRAVVMDAVSRLSNAQAALSGPRPQQCLDMMQDAASNYCLATEAWCKASYRDQAVARAREALACYHGEQAQGGPVEPVSSDERLREAEQSGVDRYTKVHPDQPRVGDVPGQPYTPRRGPQGSKATNPCANINLPGCNNGLR